MMRHLWQRIFAYSLVLVILSQAAVFLLHTYSVDNQQVKRFITEHTKSIASALDGGSLDSAKAVAQVFSRGYNRVWLEDGQGGILGGAASATGRTVTARLWGHPVDEFTLLENGGGEVRYVTVTPLRLQNVDVRLCMAFSPPKRPDRWTMFFQGILVLSFIGVLLAFWMARRVSSPLKTLRGEVMEIAGGNLEKRVTVSGRDEITDVAVAVNHMTESLAKHIRSMRELVANISHEMRSPLARMQVSLVMLEEDVRNNKMAAAHAALIGEELAHMNKLIGATLLSSKLDLAGTQNMAENVAFSELCMEMCRRHAHVFEEKGVKFIHTVESGVSFAGEETLLTTLVSNLLDNAAKYTEKGGRVSLRLEARDGTALLQVENTHPPLPDTTLAHIFDPFYRGKVATGTGAGLGLSLVAKIASLHQGIATAVNTETGVLFSVSFPQG